MPRGRSSGRPRRRKTDVDRRPQLQLFVEGRRTETDYFKHLHSLYRARVIIVVESFHGPPAQLVERAVASKRQQQYEEKHGGGKAYDEIWCVFDVDEHLWEDAVASAAEKGISVAVSNPCFELWLVLHHQEQAAYIDRKAAQRRAIELTGCGKSLTRPALDDLVAKYPAAADRAKRLDLKHHDDGSPARSNPSSDVWRVVSRIVGT